MRERFASGQPLKPDERPQVTLDKALKRLRVGVVRRVTMRRGYDAPPNQQTKRRDLRIMGERE